MKTELVNEEWKPFDPKHEYIGDGVYVALNECSQIEVRTGSHENEPLVYFEMPILMGLISYAMRNRFIDPLFFSKGIILRALESEEDKLRSEGETDAAYKYAGARMLVENLKP